MRFETAVYPAIQLVPYKAVACLEFYFFFLIFYFPFFCKAVLAFSPPTRKAVLVSPRSSHPWLSIVPTFHG